MTNSISKTGYGYTAKGNEYKKSNSGKKIGTAVGAAAGSGLVYASLGLANVTRDVMHKRLQGKTYQETMKALFDNSNAKFLKAVFSPKRVLNQLKSTAVFNSKIANSAYIVGSLSVVPLTVAGIGWLIGAGIDKIKNHSAMKKADKAAEAQKQ